MLTPCAGKSGSSWLPILLATTWHVELLAIKLLAPWRFLTFAYPHTTHNSCRRTLTAPRTSLASGGTAIIRNTHGGVTNNLLSFDNDVRLLRVPKTFQPLLPLQRPNEPIQYATRAALPETGSRVDDMYNLQGQTLAFVLFLFLRPSFSRNCCSTSWHIGLMS